MKFLLTYRYAKDVLGGCSEIKRSQVIVDAKDEADAKAKWVAELKARSQTGLLDAIKALQA